MNRTSNVPYRINHSGGLATVTVDQTDQTLAGAWQLLGTYTLDHSAYVEISSENGQANADAVRFVPTGGPSLTITTTSVPDGMMDSAYSETLSATGGSNSYSWSIDSGTLPAGLSLSTAGIISGTPTAAETQSITVEVDDGTTTVTQALTITIVLRPEVIIDNLDAETTQTGSWFVSSASNSYSTNSVYSDANGTFRWTPTLPEAGDYEVYAWWTYHANRTSNVPYRINHSGSTDTVTVDQLNQSLAGQWQLLGTYTFDGIGSEYVEVSSENGQANADAVRWLKVGSQ